jgi:hypothetical protein
LIVEQQMITRTHLGHLTPVAQPQPLPTPTRLWTTREWDAIRRGHKSRVAGDRWNAVVEGQRLFLFRSATGCGIYEVQFAPLGDSWRITELVMCGDSDVHRRDRDEVHVLHVEALIDSLMLGVWDSPAIRALQLVPA